ncbi:MAG: helix-turn-helix domain-containing protein [Proteobacteria bacterium]|nr:helix-turn-helix domain-containing protein [Verrucomicrobiota bacterium]NBU07623.1 helix-turn-helix domain-containing protein [Pseudomonadota bacterium]
MTCCPSLTLLTIPLPLGTEWSPDQPGLGFCRASGGYLLGKNLGRELTVGSVVEFANQGGVRFRASQLQTAELQYFYVRPELLGGLLTMAEQGLLTQITNRLVAAPRVLEATHPLAAEFAEVCRVTKPANELVRRAALLRLAGLALGEELDTIEPVPESKDSHDRFLLLLRKMSESELHDHTLGELARMCGCSERHFSRLFQNHFGVNFRTKKIFFRLDRAKELLRESNSKVIHTAMESGFNNVGQFNRMFKRQFGTTPSEWRQRAAKPAGRTKTTVIAGLAAMWLSLTAWAAAPTNAPPATTAASTNAPAKPTFNVRRYEVAGNTLLPPEKIANLLTNFIGPAVTVEQVLLAQKTLNLAYRREGYVTVSTALPPQKITNGVVYLQVTEGRLVEINVSGNRYFSSNNVMAALPSLRTNQFIQLQWFNPELDRANLNQDRQIYPEIVPGPEPGTSSLMLKVKDHLPLHGRIEFNNLSTPGTPDLRVNASAQYNNLWQREHSVGFQYGFSPEMFKQQNPLTSRFFDAPLIANYSTYYRMPLGGPEALRPLAAANPGAFGYDEATKQFKLPPSSGNPELSFFASRSTTDTGTKFGPTNNITRTAFLTIDSFDSGQDLSKNESFGWRVSLPLPEFSGIKSSFAAGLDYKWYHATSFNTNNFPYSITVFDAFGVPSQTTTLVSSPQPTRNKSVTYLPASLRWDVTVPDKFGQNFLFAGAAANLPVFSSPADFKTVAGSSLARNDYLTATLGWSREQPLTAGYTLLLRADGQWANVPLISNEQFGIAGSSAVRGYQDGEQFGDSGWKVSLEPRTPFHDLGMVDGTLPMRVRASAFMDYGEVYYVDPARGGSRRLWSAGLAFQGGIGQVMDARAVLGWALDGTPVSPVGSLRATFVIGMQF